MNWRQKIRLTLHRRQRFENEGKDLTAGWLDDWNLDDALSFAGVDRDESNSNGTNYDDFGLFHFHSRKQTIYCKFCKEVVSAGQVIYAHTGAAVQQLIDHHCGNFWCNEFFSGAAKIISTGLKQGATPVSVCHSLALCKHESRYAGKTIVNVGGSFHPQYNRYLEQAPEAVQHKLIGATAGANDHPFCIPCIDYAGYLATTDHFDSSVTFVYLEKREVVKRFCDGIENVEGCIKSLTDQREKLERLIDILDAPIAVCVTADMCGQEKKRRHKCYLTVSPLIWQAHEMIVSEWLEQKVTYNGYSHPKLYDHRVLRELYYSANCNWKALHEIRVHILKRLYSKGYNLQQILDFFRDFGEYDWIRAKEMALQCVGAVPLPSGQTETNCSVKDLGK